MAVYTDIRQLKAIKKPVVTIGTFDGVHHGHRAILSEVVAHAKAVAGESILLTFEPHPRKVLFPNEPLGIITPLQNKLQLIAETGIEHIVVVPFTKEFAALSANDYILHFLVEPLHPHSIVIGYDHHFGADRKGNINLLKQYGPRYNIEIVEIPAQLIEQAAVSSTRIRKALVAGQIDEANAMLGREYKLVGEVTHGNKLGRTIGYPTANLKPLDADQVIPGIGVYAVRVGYDGLTLAGMMSVGVNPTVTDTTNIKLEVNIFDFEKDVYGQMLEISFVKRLREEQKFNSIDELTNQLHLDKVAALKVL